VCVILTIVFVRLITHADDSRRSKASIRVCLSVCLSVCVSPPDRTDTAETTVTKLVTGENIPSLNTLRLFVFELCSEYYCEK